MIPNIGLYLRLGALAILVAGGVWIYVMVTNLRAQHVADQATIANQEASLAIANAAARLNAAAAEELRAQFAAAETAVAEATQKLSDVQANVQPIIVEAASAPASDKVCNSPALWRAVNRLFDPSASAGGDSGDQAGKGPGSAGPAKVSGLADPIGDGRHGRPAGGAHRRREIRLGGLFGQGRGAPGIPVDAITGLMVEEGG